MFTLDWMEVQNFSSTSVVNNSRYLADFATWAADRAIASPAEVTWSHIESYQRHVFNRRKLDGTAYSFGSQQNFLMPVKALFSYLVRNHRIDSNPAAEMTMPRHHEKLPEVALSISEVETLLATPDTYTRNGLRDRAILEVLYSSALRRRELIGLRTIDLDTSRGTLFVQRGKGGKQRVVPVGDRAISWLECYLAEVRPAFAKDASVEWLFLTSRGEQMGWDTVSVNCRRYMRKSGIAKPGSVHILRHTCAVHMLEGGAELVYIQELLGHSQITTTQRYAKVAITKLKEVHATCHPAAKSAPKPTLHVVRAS